MTWTIIATKQALKDKEKLIGCGLWSKAETLIEVLRVNPFANPPRYEKLSGDLDGFFSRRINIQHRIVYSVNEADRTVKVIRMWSHYE